MVKKCHFSIVFSPCLTTRPCLGVSEHPPNPQFQGLKIDLCSYHHPNYFSRSAPDIPSPISLNNKLLTRSPNQKDNEMDTPSDQSVTTDQNI